MSYKGSDIPPSAKTAITRKSPSALARTVSKLLQPTDMVFDWGCGKGCDLLYYLTKVDTVAGWDPHFKPTPYPSKLAESFNIITCSCVLNVLQEDERKICLQNIHNFLPSDGKVYFSVRTKHDIEQNRIKSKKPWKKEDDGWITNRGTFQHGFTSTELKKILEQYFKSVDIIKKAPVIIGAHK